MIFSINKNKEKELLDLVYDIENFIVDLEYENSGETCSPERQAYLGKLKLAKQAHVENEKRQIYLRLSSVLRDLGIREEIKGFRLICALVYERSVKLRLGEPFYLRDGYEAVAKEYGISKGCCERLCRYACDLVYFHKDFGIKYPLLSDLTHRTYEKVTVKELVDALARYVNVKQKQKNKNKAI